MKVEELDEQSELPETQSQTAAERQPAAAWRRPVFIALLLVGGGDRWFVYKGITRRVSVEKTLVQETQDSAVLTVSVVHPKVTGARQPTGFAWQHAAADRCADLCANQRLSEKVVRGYRDARAGGRSAGGDRSAGSGPATAAGEVGSANRADEFRRSRRSRRAAMANLLQKGAVARQDTDNVVGDMNSKKSIAESAAANVKRLEDLQSYEKVYAPFDGVITARNTDVGALIDAVLAARARSCSTSRRRTGCASSSMCRKNTSGPPPLVPPRR